MGEVGHPLKVISESDTGYTRTFDGYGSVWTDKIHQPGKAGRAVGAVDHLQVQDLITGEIAFFKFPCEAGEVYEQPGGASHSPAKSPAAKSPAGVVAAAPPFHSPSSGMAE